jgi:hypothetical protein
MAAAAVRTILQVDRDEYKRRIAKLRPLMAVFRGKLEHDAIGGCSGNISEHSAANEVFHLGGTVTDEQATAVVEAVNFVLDLCKRR